MRRLIAAAACVALAICTRAAFAEDTLKIAVGARGVGETFVAELGQNAGIFKKHGIKLEILYTQGGGETQQVVISDSAQIGVANGFLGTLGAFSKGAPIRIIGATFTGGSILPFIFFNHQAYTVAMSLGYGNITFSHWQDNGSTDPTRTFALNGNSTYIAIYIQG